MQRDDANAFFHIPFVATVSMRALNWGRLCLSAVIHCGQKSQTAGSTLRCTSPSSRARSRITGTGSVGAIENDGTQSRKSLPSSTNSSMRSFVLSSIANLPHMPATLRGTPVAEQRVAHRYRKYVRFALPSVSARPAV